MIFNEKINYFKLILKNSHLIEASAGTGKTYTLLLIYLRVLLLGLDKNKKPLSIKEILVVTLTEKAIKELRNKIQNYVHKLHTFCIHQENTNDCYFSTLLKQLKSVNNINLYLSHIEDQINKASIFTIHGFFKKIINCNIFQSNLLFKYTLIKNEISLFTKFSIDIWNHYLFKLPLEIIKIIKQYWKNPNSLLFDLLPCLQNNPPKILNIYNEHESIIEKHTNIINFLNEIKLKWYENYEEIYKIIKNYKFIEQKYNKKLLLLWINTINEWTIKKTINYQIPKELIYFKRFLLHTKINFDMFIKYPIFKKIKNFNVKTISIREIVLKKLLIEIKKKLEIEKKCYFRITFDDMTNDIYQFINKDKKNILINYIKNSYPIAMIDEFQDVDKQQYKIFKKIYHKDNCCLFLIGDPKQTIYSFRGASIFNYIKARNDIKHHYTLNTNWRSTKPMIDVINQLFQNSIKPFIFNEISYIPLKSSIPNNILKLKIRKKIQSSLCIWLQSKKSIKITEYLQIMTKKCTNTISDWLNAAKKGKAWWIKTGNKNKKILKASDIAILVRNHQEAIRIYNALKIKLIPVNYINNKNNIFKTLEASEILLILQAILDPENILKIFNALSTNLLNSNDILINQNKENLKQLIKKFKKYHQKWKEKGIFFMFRCLIFDYNIKNYFLTHDNGKYILNNVLQIIELLQESSIKLENEHLLTRWLFHQIKNPNIYSKKQIIKSYNNYNSSIQILTIHKSKGLEFPVVFLPFIINFNQRKHILFHNRKTHKLYIDFQYNLKNIKLAEEERLSEDLRILYVAITRAISHCIIGVSSINLSQYQNLNNNEIHLSALGYLIQQGKKGNIDWLNKCLKKLIKKSKGNICINEVCSIT